MGRWFHWSCSLICLFTLGLPAWGQEAARSLSGQWVVTDLVEDGRVIPQVAIPEWLPSGGQLEIADGAIIFKSHVDGRRYARLFTIDATRIPNLITLTDANKATIVGISKNEGNRLVVCLAPAGTDVPPADFSAEAGSKRMLMVLQRVPDPSAPATPTVPVAPAIPAAPATPAATVNPPQAPVSPPAAMVITDADIARMAVGTWRLDDQFGSLIVKFRPEGTYTTTRAVEELRLFRSVFVETPVTGGSWRVAKSQLLMTVTSSVNPARLGSTFPITVRSISPTDLIFVDYFGRVVQARRVAE